MSQTQPPGNGQGYEKKEITNKIEQQKRQRRKEDDTDYQKPEDQGTTEGIEQKKRQAT
jgi:hypothetical protein